MGPWTSLLLLPLVVGLFFAARTLRDRRRADLSAFCLDRLGWMVVTLFVVFTASFFLMRNVPGGPFDADRKLAPEVRAGLEAHFQLDRPLFEQYATALSGVVRLDLGPSMTLRDFTVMEIIGQGIGPSALLGLGALVWMLCLGIPTGVIAARRRGSATDTGLMLFATLGIAMPSFVLAGLLMMPLVFALGVLPAAGLSSLRHLILPSFCLGFPFAAQVARLVRTGMLEVLGQDWVRTARAKGLPEWRVVYGHALRGALLPVVTFLGPAMAGILTGSLVIEQVFAVPGLGTYFVESALNRDYTLSMGLVLLYTVLVYALNWLADLLHASLDPRVTPR